MGACESTAAAAGATAAAAAGQAENGDREGNGTCGPTAESLGKHNLHDALNRRQCRGRELTDTSWADLGVNDDDGADNHGDAAHCVLERLIEQHLSQTLVEGTNGAPQNVNEGDTCKDNDGNERDKRTLLAPDAPWRSDLQHFVATIRSLYNPVPFHSYHHATHVTLSANKLMASLEVMGAAAASSSGGAPLAWSSARHDLAAGHRERGTGAAAVPHTPPRLPGHGPAAGRRPALGGRGGGGRGRGPRPASEPPEVELR
mgnify:CR=1 FL=1